MRLLVPLTLLVLTACFDTKDDDGTDGSDGTSADGTGGADGADGADGTDGSDGADGTDGSDGADGTDGSDGADGTDGTPTDPTLAIVGSYFDNFGGEHVIREDTWTMDFGGGSTYDYTHTAYDNDEMWLVAENGPDNVDEEGLWSRFDWTFIGGGLYLCQTTGTAASEADALATEPADPTDLDAGCPYYGWLTMTPF